MLTNERIREIYLSCGFTVKPGQADLKPYVFESARAIEAEATAPLLARIAELETELRAEQDRRRAEINARLSAAPAAQPMTQTQVERLVSASPIYQAAINALNGVKAWRDDDGNDGFPHELRLVVEGVLMAYELRHHRIKEDKT